MFLDFSTLKKIGITEPESYLKSMLTNQDIKFFSSSCFSSFFIDRTEQEVEEQLKVAGYCDLAQLLPPNLNEKDSSKVTVFLKESLTKSLDMEIMSETYLVKRDFLRTISKSFQPKMEEKAADELKKPNIVLAIKNEQVIVSLGTSSGSSSKQTPSAKPSKGAKGGKKTAQAEPDEALVEINFIDQANLISALKAQIKELPDDLIEPLVDYYLRPLNGQYLELLKNKVETGLISTLRAGNNEQNQGQNVAASVSPKKNTMKEVQERIKTFLANARVFEKALKSLEGN